MGLRQTIKKAGRVVRILFGGKPKEPEKRERSNVRNTSPLGKATPAIENIYRKGGAEAEVSKVNTVFGPLRVKEQLNGTRFIEMNGQKQPIVPLMSPEGFVEGAYFVEEKRGKNIIKEHKAWHELSKEERETILEIMERMGKPRLDPDSFRKHKEGSAQLKFVNFGVVNGGAHHMKVLKDVIGLVTSMIAFKNVEKTFLINTAEGEQYILTKETIENLYDKDPSLISMDKDNALTIQSTRRERTKEKRETTREFLIVPFK